MAMNRTNEARPGFFRTPCFYLLTARALARKVSLMNSTEATRKIRTTNRNRFVIFTADGRFTGGSATRAAAEARCKTYANNVRKYGAVLAACTVLDSAEHPERFDFQGTQPASI